MEFVSGTTAKDMREDVVRPLRGIVSVGMGNGIRLGGAAISFG